MLQRSLTASITAELVRAGRLDPRDVVAEHLAACREQVDGHAFITICGDDVLERARRVTGGRLAGVPLVVKDQLDTADLRTTYGSGIYRSHVPTRAAEAVHRLESEGAIVVGKANMHEFAWGLTSQNEHWGDVANPVHPDHTPGGSSGGTAAALAAGLAVVGLGTDAGGSARVPAACCGLVGFKPSRGRVSSAGVRPLAPSFDTVAPMARTVSDCALLFSILAQTPVPRAGLAGRRVAFAESSPHRSAFEALGALVVDHVALPEPAADPTAVFMVECAVGHRATFPARRDEYGTDARAKWDAANAVTAVDYLAAREALSSWRDAAADLGVDLLVGPTLGRTVPRFDCNESEVRAQLGRLTRPYNYLGWAALAIGDLQISGPSDEIVLAAGLAWEEAELPIPEPIFDQV